MALLLLRLLPKNKKLRLCIDRTEWDFGSHQVNILMVTVSSGELTELTVPFYWEMLDNNSGSASVQQRTDLLDWCIGVLVYWPDWGTENRHRHWSLVTGSL